MAFQFDGSPERGFQRRMTAARDASARTPEAHAVRPPRLQRVAIVGSRGIPGRYGGFETCAERLGTGLVELGYAVTVACPKGQAYREPTYQGVRLDFCPHPKGYLGSLLYDAVALLKASFRRDDVILMLGYASSPFCLIPRLLGSRVIINTNGLEWRRSKWPWYGRLCLRLAEKVAVWVASDLISDSKTIQQYYLDRHNVTSIFIPYGVEVNGDLGADALGEYQLKPQNYYAVVMRMEPENSIREIVQGFLEAETARTLVLIGAATRFFDAQVKPLVDTSGGKIRHLGAIYDRRMLFQIRQNAYAYIHGHTVGGTNPSLLEAMASGNLVLARDVRFNREVLEDIGFYFESARDLAAAIRCVERASDSDVADRRARARDRILKHYTWDIIVDQYHSLLTNRRGDG